MLRNKDLTKMVLAQRRKAHPIIERPVIPAFISDSAEDIKEMTAPRIRRVKQRKILSGSFLARPGEQLAAQTPPSFSDIFTRLAGPKLFCPHGKEAQHRIDKGGVSQIAS